MISIKTIEWLKIPEGIRVPVINRFWGPFLNNLVQKRARKVAGGTDKLKILGNDKPEEIVVSMTSFPARIEYVYLSLSQLFNQTLPPDKIELWLAEPQFPTHELPENLKPLIDLGLEVKFCPEDIKGHKKYYYAMQSHPESLVITFDDDLIYHEECIEELYNSYLQHKDCVHCLRGVNIALDSNGAVAPYDKWKKRFKGDVPQLSIMPSTGAGTLYPPHLLSEEVFNIEMLKRICLTADDLWMKTMSLLNGVKVRRIEKNHRPLTTITGSQTVTLADENIFNSKNDECVRNLVNQYPGAFKKLKA